MPKKLDSGGQGQIYEVDKDTVYKIIKFSDHYKEISELAILHSLQHPCMIKLKRWELSQHECKMYMERMHVNCYEFSKRATFEKRLEIFPQVFWTMVRVARFFQRNGIMNCDIKPENVMLSRDGTVVKIIDFGHMISDENYPIIGTRSYQPPELWMDDKYSPKSMVWSIGMTALEFLYRVHPIVDIIYGEDSDDEDMSNSNGQQSDSRTPSYTGSDSNDSTDSDDEYRNKYTNLFEILMEEGESLPFRHRLSPPSDALRDKLRVINNMLERMLTYDPVKRISMDELYHHRLFDNLRKDIKEEPIVTKPYEQLYCDREYTPLFMNLGRKLYREEIMYSSYMLLSMYLEKKQRVGRTEFMVNAMACLDIMSYTFSMVPSSRDMYRSVILSLRKITEHHIFERVIEILRAVKFNIFFHGTVDLIRAQDGDVCFPLLLELMELEAEAGKKTMTQDRLMERYTSSELMEDEKDDARSVKRSPSLPPNDKLADDPPSINLSKNDACGVAAAGAGAEPDTKPKREKKPVIINEYDLDPDFLKTFKEQIRLVHQQELLRKQQEETHGDVLVITL
jgi:serine/threonine protein kinase